MITTLTKENFEKEIKTGTVVVKFAVRNGCWPCDEFKEHYKLASEAQNGIKYCEYVREWLPKSADDFDNIEKKYGIRSFPTVLLFENGEKKENVKRFKFYSDRVLTWFQLEAREKLVKAQKDCYSQQCFCEDIDAEVEKRRNIAPIEILPITKWAKKK